MPVSCTRFDGGREPAATPILFVHGGGANASWWHAVVSLVAPHRPVATIDLSGHGASGRRPHYSYTQWAEEVASAAELLFPGGCALVGHSLGGALACFVAANGLYPVTTVVSLDGNPAGPPPDRRPGTRTRPVRPRCFASREEAVDALAARRAGWPRWLARHVAGRSITETAGGWRTCGDPATVSVPVVPTRFEDLAPTPAVFVVGTRSPFFPRDHAVIERHRRAGTEGFRAHVVAGVGHDLMMEDPAGCTRLVLDVT